MKIMFVSENKAVGLAGGVERVISDFANEFVQRGHSVSFVCMDPQRGTMFFPLDERVDFINLSYKYGESPFSSIKWSCKKIERELIRAFLGRKMRLMGHQIADPKQEYFRTVFVRRLREYFLDVGFPDIILTVHINGPGLVQEALDDKEIPIIAMCHADPISSTDFDIPARVEEWKRCAAVQVLLPVFVEPMEKYGFNNVIQIPNPVRKIPKEKCRNLQKCYHRIITVGRFEGVGKRQHLLIEAFSMIAQKYPEWRVDMYGNVDSKRYFDRLQKMVSDYNLDNRINFKGTIRNIYDCLETADIFAFPTASEAMSIAMTEAMSMGLPVVAFRECLSNSYIVKDGETGCLCKADVECFAQGIEKLIQDDLLRESMGRKACEAMEEYEPQKIWDIWEDTLFKYANV